MPDAPHTIINGALRMEETEPALRERVELIALGAEERRLTTRKHFQVDLEPANPFLVS